MSNESATHSCGLADRLLRSRPARPTPSSSIFSLDGLEAPNFTAKAVTVSVSDKAFRLGVGELAILGRTWRNVTRHLRHVSLGTRSHRVPRRRRRYGIEDARRVFLPAENPRARLTASPQPKETLAPAGKLPGADAPDASLRWTTARSRTLPHGYRVACRRPAPERSTGSSRSTRGGEQSLAGDVELRGAAFSDASGLHAGEKLDADIKLTAQAAGSGMALAGGARMERRRGFLATALPARRRPDAARRGRARRAAHRRCALDRPLSGCRRGGSFRRRMGPPSRPLAERERALGNA